MMKDYYLRATNFARILETAVDIGVLVEYEGTYSAVSGGWDYIGEIHRPTGETIVVDGIETDVTEPVCDNAGNVYLHANLRTDADVTGLSAFFVTDENGLLKAPNNPARVWF